MEREQAIKNDLADALLTKDGGRALKPLHDLINYKFVVHLHPTVNSVMCATTLKTRTAVRRQCFCVLLIPAILFKAVEARVKTSRGKGYDPKIILLQNHGIS